MIDILFPARSDDDSMASDSPQVRMGELGVKASTILGRPIDSAAHYKEQMIAAGFENVTETLYKWPTNRWPRDRKMKEIGASLLPCRLWDLIECELADEDSGMWAHEAIAGSLSGLTLGYFTRGLGWTMEEVEVFLVDVRKEMKDTKVHAWMPMYAPIKITSSEAVIFC